MDWFQSITGFAEGSYDETRARLSVEDSELVSGVNGQRHGVGELELVSLNDLRRRVLSASVAAGRLKLTNVVGDAGAMHSASEFDSALFQVASQFNLLEMVSPEITPEHGVTRYRYDRTQGPACAIAAGAATIYRNYFAPVASGHGQTANRQLDGIADLGAVLSHTLGMPETSLWRMRNGYALGTQRGLIAIAQHLEEIDEPARDVLRGLLCIGVHRDVEVTTGSQSKLQHVSQAFCSAMPVAYSSIAGAVWEPLARLVLEAAYEATLLAALLNAQRGTSDIVLLTRLGGGAFGNDDRWIDDAMHRALTCVAERALDVRLVSFGAPHASLLRLEKAFA